jgi:hypothetical protein
VLAVGRLAGARDVDADDAPAPVGGAQPGRAAAVAAAQQAVEPAAAFLPAMQRDPDPVAGSSSSGDRSTGSMTSSTMFSAAVLLSAGVSKSSCSPRTPVPRLPKPTKVMRSPPSSSWANSGGGPESVTGPSRRTTAASYPPRLLPSPFHSGCTNSRVPCRTCPLRVR